MAATPEKKVKQKIRAVLDNFGAYHFMPATHGYGASGTADIVVCYKGLFIAIEAKATAKNKPTALQTDAAEMVVQAGGIALLIHADNSHVVAEALSSVDQGVKPSNVWPGLFEGSHDE